MPDPGDLHIDFKLDGSTLIKGEQEDIETKHGSGIRRIQVDQRLESPDFFSVELWSTSHADQNLVDAIKPGAKVEIELGYGTEGCVFKGEVSYLEPHFDPREQYVVVSGYDRSHRLTRGTSSRTFGDGHKDKQSPGDVLGKIVDEAKSREGGKSDGLSAEKGSAKSQLEYIAQYNQNDYQFLSQVIGSFGLGWDNKSYEADNKVSMKALEAGGTVCKIGRDLGASGTQPASEGASDLQAVSADFRLSTVRQVAKVEVRGWDPYTKKALKGEAKALTTPFPSGKAKPGKDQAGMAHYEAASAGRVVTIVDLPVASNDEATEIAKSLMDKFGMDWMTADVVVKGSPDLAAGKVVEMVDFGKRWSGKYFIEQCQHVFIAGAGKPYRCFLKLARNSSEEPS